MIPGSDHHILSLPPDPGGEAGARTPWGADCPPVPCRAEQCRAVPARLPLAESCCLEGGARTGRWGWGSSQGWRPPIPCPVHVQLCHTELRSGHTRLIDGTCCAGAAPLPPWSGVWGQEGLGQGTPIHLRAGICCRFCLSSAAQGLRQKG